MKVYDDFLLWLCDKATSGFVGFVIAVFALPSIVLMVSAYVSLVLITLVSPIAGAIVIGLFIILMIYSVITARKLFWLRGVLFKGLREGFWGSKLKSLPPWIVDVSRYAVSKGFTVVSVQQPYSGVIRVLDESDAAPTVQALSDTVTYGWYTGVSSSPAQSVTVPINPRRKHIIVGVSDSGVLVYS